MSDSDTSDSDSGVRYKTTTTRHNHAPSREQPERPSYRDSSSSRSRSDRRYHHRSRSPTPERRRYRRRSRTPESSSRSRHTSRSARSSRNASPEPGSRRVKDDVKTLDVSVSSVSSQEDHAPQRSRAAESPTECFGPALPPALAQPSKSEKKEDQEHAKGVIGPALPPHLLASKTKHQDDEDREEKPERGVIGPALPPGMKLSEAAPSHDHATSDSELSPFSEPEQEDESNDDEDEDDDEMIGPLPGTSGSRANVELEQRALEMKIRQIESAATGANGDREQPKAREDWMLELPDIRKISDMGLGARQFRTREKQEIGDRTVWTDTPADRERKKASGGGGGSSKAVDAAAERERERERKLIAKRDKEQEELVKRHKKKHKRDKALLDIHQKKLKKEKESKGSEEAIRRPFDRNVDLQANRFDEAQKKAVLKKAQLLDTRFSSGSSKYL